MLKNLVQVGFGDITIIDLDTIDLSNLNRQFLFQKQHVKRPKALVAKETASRFNPSVKIDAIHGNIKEPQYDVDWFKSFDLVTNALDNLGEQSLQRVGQIMAYTLPLTPSRRAEMGQQDVFSSRHSSHRKWHSWLHWPGPAYQEGQPSLRHLQDLRLR